MNSDRFRILALMAILAIIFQGCLDSEDADLPNQIMMIQDVGLKGRCELKMSVATAARSLGAHARRKSRDRSTGIAIYEFGGLPLTAVVDSNDQISKITARFCESPQISVGLVLSGTNNIIIPLSKVSTRQNVIEKCGELKRSFGHSEVGGTNYSQCYLSGIPHSVEWADAEEYIVYPHRGLTFLFKRGLLSEMSMESAIR